MVWIIFTLIIVVSFVGSTFLKNNIFNKLLKDMQKQDFDTFFKRLDSFTTKLFYAPFNSCLLYTSMFLRLKILLFHLCEQVEIPFEKKNRTLLELL